jgi:hypothetical protein
MADQASLNENLIALGLNTSNPQNTYSDFATQITKNQQEQAAQEQALALAKEHVAQAKNQTREEGEAAATGYNSILKDQMTPEEAIAAVKAAMAVKGLKADDAIAEWASKLPATVNRLSVENFISHLTKESTRAGQATPFAKSDDIDIPEGVTAKELGLVADPVKPGIGHVPEDGMYQVVYDNQGILKRFIPGGKEAADPSIKLGQKQEQFDAKRWSDLEKELTKVISSNRGNQLSAAVYRADRAINEIADPETLMPQVLSFIGKDLAGIFQGGVPPVAGMEKEEFETAFQALNRFVQKYTGVTAMFRTDTGDQREKLTKLIVRLRDSTLDILQNLLESKLEGYRDIIDKDKDRWNRILADKLKAVRSGLTKQAEGATNDHTEFPGQKYPEKDGAKAAPAAGDAPVKLPSAADIKAERERRKKEKK